MGDYVFLTAVVRGYDRGPKEELDIADLGDGVTSVLSLARSTIRAKKVPGY